MVTLTRYVSTPRREGVVATALLLTLLVLLFWPAVFLGRALLPVDLIFALDPVWQAVAPPGFERAGNPIQSDVVYQFYPWRVFTQHWLSQGIVPLWNPLILGGVSFIGNDQSALFYPINLMSYLFPPAAGIAFSAFARLLIAGLSTYGYLRAIGRSIPAAYLGAIAFMLGGWPIVWLNWPHMNVAVWLPTILLLVELIFRDRRLPWAGLLALVVGTQFLGGHVETSFHVGLVAAAYLLFLTVRAWRSGDHARARRGFGFALLGAALGFGVGAIQIVPFLGQLAQSGLAEERSGSFYGNSFWIYPGFWRELATLPTLIFPNLLGNPTDRAYWPFFANYNESVAYIGTLPLLLAGAGVLAVRQESRTLFWLLAAIVSFGIAYRLPLFEAINHLPLFEVAANGRLRLILSFALIVLAAAGFDWVQTEFRQPERRHRLRLTVRALFALGIAGLLAIAAGYAALLVLREPIRRFGREYVTEQLDGRPDLPYSLDYYLSKVEDFYQATLDRFSPAGFELYLPVLIVLVAAGLGWLVLTNRLAPRRAMAALPALTALELVVLAAGYNPTLDAEQVYPSTPAIEFLRQHAGSGRIAGLGFALTPNSGMVFGLNDLRGYEVVRPARSWQLLREMEGRRPFGGFLILDRATSPLYDLFGVRYLVATSDLNLSSEDWQLVLTDQGVNVYENQRAMPRAYLVGNAFIVDSPAEALAAIQDGRANDRSVKSGSTAPAGSTPDPVPPANRPAGEPGGDVLFLPNLGAHVRRPVALRAEVVLEADQEPPAVSGGLRQAAATIVEENPLEVVIQAQLSDPGYLVLGDSFDRDWIGRVNGVPTRVFRANHGFRAVYLEPGDHRIEFHYRPASVALGAGVTVFSLLFLLSLTVAGRGQQIPFKRPMAVGFRR